MPVTRSRPILRPCICWSTCQPKASQVASSSTCGYPAWTVRHLQKRLGELGSTLPIIFLTGFLDIPVTVQAIKAGAADVLTKPVASDDLFRAIETAIAHHQTLRDLKNKLDSVRARLGRLTPRERQVFDLVIRGNPNKQVARALGCTERTVKAHRHRVMEKMQARSLPELVSLAERVGLLGDASGSQPTN